MVNIDKIEQAAEAATRGPWTQEYTNKCEPDGEGGSIFSEGVAIVSQPTRKTIIEIFGDPFSEEDLSHITNCDPQTILKLIAVVRAAKAMIDLYDKLALVLPGSEPDALRKALEALK